MIRFVKKETGQVYLGYPPHVHWFDGARRQPAGIWAYENILILSDSSTLSASTGGIFRLFDASQIGEETELLDETFTDIDAVTSSSLTLTGTELEDGSFLFSLLILAESDAEGEFLGDLTLGGETFRVGCAFVSEDEFLTLNLSNRGVEIPGEITKAMPDGDLLEDKTNFELLNTKWRELLENYMDTLGSKGSYSSLLSSLRWFGWESAVKLREVWKVESPGGPLFEEHEVGNWFDAYWKSRQNSASKTTFFTLHHYSADFSEETNTLSSDWNYSTPFLRGIMDDDLEEFCLRWSRDELRLKLFLLGYFFEKFFMPVHLDLLRSTLVDTHLATPTSWSWGAQSTLSEVSQHALSTDFDVVVSGGLDVRAMAQSTPEAILLSGESLSSEDILSSLETTTTLLEIQVSEETTSLIVTVSSDGSWSLSMGYEDVNTFYVFSGLGGGGISSAEFEEVVRDAAEVGGGILLLDSNLSAGSAIYLLMTPTDSGWVLDYASPGIAYEVDGNLLALVGDSLTQVDEVLTSLDSTSSNLSADGYYEFRLGEVHVFGWIPPTLSYSGDDEYTPDATLSPYSLTNSSGETQKLLFSSWDEEDPESTVVGCVPASQLASEEDFTSSGETIEDDSFLSAFFSQNFSGVGTVISLATYNTEQIISGKIITNLTGVPQTLSESEVLSEELTILDEAGGEVRTVHKTRFDLLACADGEYYVTLIFEGLSGQTYTKYLRFRILDNVRVGIGIHKLEYVGPGASGEGASIRSMFLATHPDPQLAEAEWVEDESGLFALDSEIIETLRKKMSSIVFLPGELAKNYCYTLYEISWDSAPSDLISLSVSEFRDLIEGENEDWEVLIRTSNTEADSEDDVLVSEITSLTLIYHGDEEAPDPSLTILDTDISGEGSTRTFKTFIPWYYSLSPTTALTRDECGIIIPTISLTTLDDTQKPVAYSNYLPLSQSKQNRWEVISTHTHSDILSHKFPTQTPLIAPRYRQTLPLGYYDVTLRWMWGSESRSTTSKHLFKVVSS